MPHLVVQQAAQGAAGAAQRANAANRALAASISRDRRPKPHLPTSPSPAGASTSGWVPVRRCHRRRFRGWIGSERRTPAGARALSFGRALAARDHGAQEVFAVREAVPSPGAAALQPCAIGFQGDRAKVSSSIITRSASRAPGAITWAPSRSINPQPSAVSTAATPPKRAEPAAIAAPSAIPRRAR